MRASDLRRYVPVPKKHLYHWSGVLLRCPYSSSQLFEMALKLKVLFKVRKTSPSRLLPLTPRPSAFRSSSSVSFAKWFSFFRVMTGTWSICKLLQIWKVCWGCSHFWSENLLSNYSLCRLDNKYFDVTWSTKMYIWCWGNIHVCTGTPLSFFVFVSTAYSRVAFWF